MNWLQLSSAFFGGSRLFGLISHRLSTVNSSIRPYAEEHHILFSIAKILQRPRSKQTTTTKKKLMGVDGLDPVLTCVFHLFFTHKKTSGMMRFSLFFDNFNPFPIWIWLNGGHSIEPVRIQKETLKYLANNLIPPITARYSSFQRLDGRFIIYYLLLPHSWFAWMDFN